MCVVGWVGACVRVGVPAWACESEGVNVDRRLGIKHDCKYECKRECKGERERGGEGGREGGGEGGREIQGNCRRRSSRQTRRRIHVSYEEEEEDTKKLSPALRNTFA